MWEIPLAIVGMSACIVAFKIAELKYGETRRQDALEERLDALLAKFKNADSEKIDKMQQEITQLKIKVGFR